MRYVIDVDGVITTKEHWSYEDSYLRHKEMLMNVGVNKKVIDYE